MHVLSLVNTSLRWSTLFCIALARAVLLGFNWRGGFSSHSVNTYLLMRLSSSQWVCFVLQCAFQTPWPSGKKLRTPLHYWGFPFLIFFVWHFSGGGSKICWQVLSHWKFPRKFLRFYLFLIFLAVSTLVSEFLFSFCLIWRVSLGSCLSKTFFCFLGALKLLEVLIRACEKFPRKSSPCLLVLSLSYKAVLLGSLLCYPLDVLCWPSFLFIL